MNELNQPDQTPELSFSFDALDYLEEACKWANILSVIGFVFVGILVIMAFALGPMISSMYAQSGVAVPGGLLTFVYLAMALIYFFPIFYLFNFARSTKKAIVNNDTEAMAKGFKNLKSHYKFIGILSLIILGFYGLFFIFFMIGGAIPSMMT